MSTGFLAVNNNNEVLISSDTKNLQFAGKATKPSTPLSNFVNHGGFVELVYTIVLSDRSSIPVPFFTMPDDSKFHSIAGVKGVNSGTLEKTWSITILRSGGSTTQVTMPEVYVFVEPVAITMSGGNGLQVFNDDTTVCFDSRARPLAVTSAVSVIQPSNPVSSASFASLSAAQCGNINNNNFTPTQTNSYNFGATTSQPTKPMYHYNGLAQSQREASFYQYTESCTGINAYGFCIGYESSLSNTSTYWAFYRGAIGGKTITGSDTYLKAGWVPVIAGCYWSSVSSGAFLQIFGPGTSGSSGGAWPYSDETINLAAQTVIVGDASRYD
jgi:hypothetical protein